MCGHHASKLTECRGVAVQRGHFAYRGIDILAEQKNTSTPPVAFMNRMCRFDGDLEYADILVGHTKAQSLRMMQPGCSKIKIQRNTRRYPNIRTANRIAAWLYAHLRSTVHAACIEDAHEEIHIYLQIMSLESFDAARMESKRIVGGQDVQFKASEILERSIDGTLVPTVIGLLFRDLDLRSDLSQLIREVYRKLDPEPAKNILKKAVSYLQLRNLLLHSRSEISERTSRHDMQEKRPDQADIPSDHAVQRRNLPID